MACSVRVVFIIFLGIGWGCGAEEPVLTGIPAQPILTEAPDEEEETVEAPMLPESVPEPGYTKGEGVYVDMRHIGGKPYREVRELVAEQLGTLLKTEDIDNPIGEDMSFSRGLLRVVDDRICMIRVTLPYPMRRSEALQALGFPPYVDRYLITHREYRLNNEWGFRRLRLKRKDAQSEDVLEVEAWSWIPGEHLNRR